MRGNTHRHTHDNEHLNLRLHEVKWSVGPLYGKVKVSPHQFITLCLTLARLPNLLIIGARDKVMKHFTLSQDRMAADTVDP